MDVGSKQLSKQAKLQNASAMKPHNMPTTSIEQHQIHQSP